MTREALLKRVQVADFALIEARLFLDTHPSDAAAKEYYRKHFAQSEAARREFESKYGPLLENSENGAGADWISDPWPWENMGRNA